MPKIMFTAANAMSAYQGRGLQFKDGQVADVSDEDYKYLTENFPYNFTAAGKKPAVRPPTKEEVEVKKNLARTGAK